MARPIKKGLDYFPLDVDFLSDLKVRRIIKACGKESVHILVALLANIYRDEGYYVLWDDDLAFLVADEVGTKEGTVEELVKKAVQVKFFDKDIFDKYSALTSKGIQNRYILATKERKIVELEFKYLLTNEVNRSNISINGRNNPDNHGSNQQRKEKESKEKKSKVNDAGTNLNSISTYTAVSYWLEQVNPAEAPTILESINFWVEDFKGSQDIVILAIDEMLKNGARSYRYLEKILKNWESRKLDTVDKVHKFLNKDYQRVSENTNKKTVKNSLPWWSEMTNDDLLEYEKMTDEERKERGWFDE